MRGIGVRQIAAGDRCGAGCIDQHVGCAAGEDTGGNLSMAARYDDPGRAVVGNFASADGSQTCRTTDLHAEDGRVLHLS